MPSKWWWGTWKVLSGGRLGLAPYSASRSPHACSSVFSPRLDLPSRLEGAEPDPAARTFEVIARRYTIEVIPQRQYLDKRGQAAKARANREKALLSHIFNKAREWDYTDAPNPCQGVKGFKESGRDRYVTDAEYGAVWEQADQTLRDAMDVALLTGQRPADVLKIKVVGIHDGALWIVQNKPGAKRAIELSGEPGQLVATINGRTYVRRSAFLIQDISGKPLSVLAMRSRFDKARTKAGVSFQFRDIRAKAATDTGDLAHSQRLLEHRNREMTEHYVRQRVGERVKPLR